MSLQRLRRIATNVAGEVAERAGDIASSSLHSSATVLLAAKHIVKIDFNKLVTAFEEHTTPIEIPAFVTLNTHGGPSIENNYDILFDTAAYISARADGPFVRPDIVLYSPTAVMDREALAKALESDFAYRLQRDEEKVATLRSQRSVSAQAEVTESKEKLAEGAAANVELAIISVVLSFMSLGFLAPFLAMIGVANNVDMAREAVRLIFLYGKLQLTENRLLPSRESRTARDIERLNKRAKTAFYRSVQNMKIHVHPELRAAALENGYVLAQDEVLDSEAPAVPTFANYNN